MDTRELYFDAPWMWVKIRLLVKLSKTMCVQQSHDLTSIIAGLKIMEQIIEHQVAYMQLSDWKLSALCSRMDNS